MPEATDIVDREPPSGSETDSSDSDVETIADEDIPRHFDERGQRLFHSHGTTLPYPLPADTPEQERLKMLHDIVTILIGGNHFGPVDQVLQQAAGIRRRALDLCTGGGLWVLEMAAQFSHVKFFGIDIVPIASRYPPDNVQFEIHDVTTPLRFSASYFDLVHFRHAQLAIPRPAPLVAEISRILRPGGLFLSGDWESNFELQNGSHPENAAPGVFRYFLIFNSLMGQKGVCVAPAIRYHLANSNSFTDIVPAEYRVIMNSDQGAYINRIGEQMKVVFLGFVNSTKDTFLSAGFSADQFADIRTMLERDLNNVPGLTFIYRTVRARKINRV